MKSIYLIILLILTATSNAQNNTLYARDPDLIIIRSRLDYIDRIDPARPHLLTRQGEPHTYESQRPKDEWAGKAELEIQNTGSRKIKSFEWEIFLKEEKNSENKTLSYRVRSNKAIRPGEKVKVTGLIKSPSLEGLRDALNDGSLQVHAEIKRVNYEDGGIWAPLKVKPVQK